MKKDIAWNINQRKKMRIYTNLKQTTEQEGLSENKEEHYEKIKGWQPPKDIIIPYAYAPNNTFSKYRRQ